MNVEMNPSGTTGFVNNNNNNNNVLVQEDGSLSFPMTLIVLGIVLVLSSGSWGFGCLAITLGFGWAVCRSAMDQIPEQDKQEIRYNILYADDVVHELEAWEQALSLPQEQDNPNHTNTSPTTALDRQRQQARIHCIAGLEALAKKYAKQQQQLALMEAAARKKNPQEQERSANSINSNVAPKHHLELLCQQAAYIAYRMFPTTGNDDDNDPVMAAAFSLHALVAKDAQVRQRHLFQADVYGLNIPINCMHNALQSAQRETNDDREQQYAELVRKACLLLGALGDGDAAMATQIVDEGGLDAIFNAMNWYRYHQDVANWALWAIFVLNVDHGPNKLAMVEMGGVPLVIQTMKCNMISQDQDDCDVEVARHGMAILFDLLKDDNNTQQQSDSASSNKQLNVWQIRKSALAAGLHVAVLQAMEQFSHTIDIIMMGQEILAGTDYRGPVPQYQPQKEDIAG